MKNEKEWTLMETWKAAIAAALAGVSAYLQHLIAPVMILVLVMIFDYATGVAKAWMKKELCSGVGHAGIVKKVANMALVAVGMIVDYIVRLGIVEIGMEINMDGRYFFGVLVIVWLILNELISITENCAELGMKVPEFLKKALRIAQSSAAPKMNNYETEE